jgi:hypothetical protein
MNAERHPLGRHCGGALPKALLMTAVVLVKMLAGRLPKSW